MMTTTGSQPADMHILARRQGRLGVITLNRAPALNALSLGMVRELTRCLREWEVDDHIDAVLVHGASRPGKAPAFCAGGDIRFFHQAALAGDPRLEDFFTEEYALNHLIHGYAKPCIAWMDGVCMGGGMGIAQGASHRVVTEHSKLAMPETRIGLFPDVGGGWFLSRCGGRLGEYLAVTGHVLHAADAIETGLADIELPSAALPAVIQALAARPWLTMQSVADTLRAHAAPVHAKAPISAARAAIDEHFAAPSETVEGIRALAIDKDHAPRWRPPRADEVTPAMVEAFFASPWPAWAHPLAHLR